MIMSVGRGRPMPEDPAEREKAMVSALLQSVTLTVKGEQPLHSDRLFQTSDKQSLIFGFQKEKLPLTVANKSVEFALKIGQVTYKAKFDLKDMTYGGELAV